MPTPTSPDTEDALEVALSYYRAWTGHDFEQAMNYIADDIVCDAPAVASKAPIRFGHSWSHSVGSSRTLN